MQGLSHYLEHMLFMGRCAAAPSAAQLPACASAHTHDGVGACSWLLSSGNLDGYVVYTCDAKECWPLPAHVE